jgi:2-C-methyl-D-erythritol 2,4-cyclodiphosphate synthase
MAVRFDPPARKAIDFAMKEVERLGHSTLDTGHLLLGLLEQRDGAVTAAIGMLGVNIESLRAGAATALIAGAPRGPDQRLEVAGITEQILERASALAARRGAETVTDFDILLATAERGETVAGTILRNAGVTAERLQTVAISVVSAPRAARASAPVPAPAPPGGRSAVPAAVTRVGMGYDSHRFAPGGPLVLGGITVPLDLHLDGHSDGDAIAHAITDAILGAAAAGDIGELFSDRDPANKGRSSLDMLRVAISVVRDRGLRVQQVDVAVVAEQPKIAPHRDAMRRALAVVLGVEAESISIKGKTNEGMGWIGRGEGIACFAVATLVTAPTQG